MAVSSSHAAAFYSGFKPELMQAQHPALIETFTQRMQPEKCSGVGFLAPGQNLVDVCQKDAEILKARGITHEQIADRLEAVIMKAEFLFEQRLKKFGFFYPQANRLVPQAIIEDKICVPKYESFLGYQYCPFSQDLENEETVCGKGCSMIKIINMASKKCISNITELHGHLIKDHHFFEGHPPYRLDPELAIEVLGIEPGVDYKVKTFNKSEWQVSRSTNVYQKEELQFARENKTESIITDEFEAHLLPYETFTPLEAIWLTDERLYLHIFKFKKTLTDTDKTYKIGNVSINAREIDRGLDHSVYITNESTYPILFEGDRLEENQTD